MSRRSPLLFYCQHSLGMGHLMRSLALTQALAARFDVTFASGGELPDHMNARADVRLVRLPPVGVDAEGRMVSRDGRRTLERALAERRRILLGLFRAVQPHVVVIELFPFGRRKFTQELQPLLDEARRGAATDPRVYCSLRDILVSRRDRQREHDARATALLARYFDGVLVHSDPLFARLEESLSPGMSIPVPVHYTGFVHDTRESSRRRRRLGAGSIIVSAGGGMVGASLLRTAIEAHALVPAARRRPLAVLTGSLAPPEVWRELRAMAATRPDVHVLRSVPSLAAELRRAAGSISQCGYNTAMDLLHSRVPALVVPFGGVEEDEQLRRARRLEGLGALRVLPSSELTPKRLATEMAALPDFAPSATRLDMNGAAHTASLLHDLMRRGPATDTASSPAHLEEARP